MSSSTEAPTSSATSEALANQGKTLGEIELKFLTLLHQHYSMTGELLSKQEAINEYGFDPKEFEELYHDKLVQSALQERGLIDRRTLPETGSAKWAAKHGLTPIQLIVANAMMDMNDTRSNRKKLQDFGVSTGLYSTWLKDKVFQKYLSQLGENLLTENQHEAMLALIDKVKQGDSKALTLYLEMTGRFVSESGSNTNDSNKVDAEAQDFRALLVKLLEILNDEIDDPSLAARISERIKGLISAQSMANQLMDTTPIEKPEVRSVNTLAISEGSDNL